MNGYVSLVFRRTTHKKRGRYFLIVLCVKPLVQRQPPLKQGVRSHNASRTTPQLAEHRNSSERPALQIFKLDPRV